MRGGQQAADIVLGSLVGVKRDQLERRIHSFAIQSICLEQSAGDNVRVRIVEINGSEHCDISYGRRVRNLDSLREENSGEECANEDPMRRPVPPPQVGAERWSGTRHIRFNFHSISEFAPRRKPKTLECEYEPVGGTAQTPNRGPLRLRE